MDREYLNIVELSIYSTHTNLTSLTDAIDQTTSASQAIIILINVSTSNLCSVNFCFGHFSQHQTKVGKRENGEEEKGSKIFIIENVFCHWIGWNRVSQLLDQNLLAVWQKRLKQERFMVSAAPWTEGGEKQYLLILGESFGWLWPMRQWLHLFCGFFVQRRCLFKPDIAQGQLRFRVFRWVRWKQNILKQESPVKNVWRKLESNPGALRHELTKLSSKPPPFSFYEILWLLTAELCMKLSLCYRGICYCLTTHWYKVKSADCLEGKWRN